MMQFEHNDTRIKQKLTILAVEKRTTMISRNSHVISKALKNFLSASVMTSLAGQLAVTTDAVIVSHMVGPDALSAINIVMPLTMLFSCASILIGLGASVLAARAIGDRDKERVNSIFTIALIMLTAVGIAVSATTYISSHDIAYALCDDARIAPYAFEYTRIITGGALFLIISNGINYFVSTDGNPGLVTRGVAAGAVANVVLDIILVGQMGIAGSAWATIINYMITLAVVLTHFFRRGSSYRLVNPLKGLGGHIVRNIYEGLPLMLGNLLLGGAVFIINSMILGAAGADGVYIWSVCLQVLMLTFVILNGVGNAMLSIGGVLMGEKDYNGIRILTRLSTGFVSAALTLFVLLVVLFPEVPAYLFGAEGAPAGIDTTTPLRIFSLLLVPFAVTLIMRFLFQILEYRILSLLMSVGQLMGIIATLWIFIRIDPDILWWSFPVSAAVLIVIQLAATSAIYMRRRGISPVTLIPDEPEGERSIDLSIAYNEKATSLAITKIEEFMGLCGVDTRIADRLKECCNEIMHSLIIGAKRKKRCFDIHIRIIGNDVHAVLRDAGHRSDARLLPATLPATVEHKYMYGQNVLFVQLKEEQT